MLVDAPKLVRGVVDMQRGGALADTEQSAYLPCRLAVHGPAQRLEFPWCQGRCSRSRQRGGQDTKRGVLRADREKLQISDETSCLRRVFRNGLVAIDT